ncbi:MAG: carboxypeptidase regulatory-like domain-containing protein [Burkholderiales bacterium]|nr:carboxypeptidase regulatory-like domain-containing protein [Burkholderiales bacterium]
MAELATAALSAGRMRLRCRIARAAALLLAATAQHAGAQPLAFATEGDVRYACGGAGVEERRALAALEADANLTLMFVTKKRGGFLADAEVTIADAAGKPLLRTVAPGPLCVLRLPQGRYRVSASFGGASRTASVAVPAQPGKPQRVVFAFAGEKWDGIWASDEEKASARSP